MTDLPHTFNEKLQRILEIGKINAALYEEAAALRANVLSFYEHTHGVLGEKDKGEFIWKNPATGKYDTVVEVSRATLSKDVNIGFRPIKSMEIVCEVCCLPLPAPIHELRKRQCPKCNPAVELPIATEDFCGHCNRETKQLFTSGGHERDSSGDHYKCLECGWYKTGGSDEWNPPFEEVMRNDSQLGMENES